MTNRDRLKVGLVVVGVASAECIYSNHNETIDSDDSEAEDDFRQFADLELTDEYLAEVKGGPGVVYVLRSRLRGSRRDDGER